MEENLPTQHTRLHLWAVIVSTVVAVVSLGVIFFFLPSFTVSSPDRAAEESVPSENREEGEEQGNRLEEINLRLPSLSLFIPDPQEDYSEWENQGKERLPDNSGYPRAGEAILYRGQLINTPLCSAGFYIFNKKENARLVTAEHCGYGVFSTRDGEIIGETTDIQVRDADVQFLSVAGAVPYVRHFNTMLPIVGEAEYAAGDRVCRTGAATGTVCNLVIRNIDGEEVQYTTTGKVYEGLLRIQGWEPTKIATTVGDSGGVVYKVDRDTGTATIVGIQVAGDGEMLCYDYEGQVCYRSAYVLPVDSILGEKFRLATVEDLVSFEEN